MGSTSTLEFTLDTRLSDLAARLRLLLKSSMSLILVTLAGTTAWLVVTSRPGASTFALLAAGVAIGITAWRHAGIGLPMLPMMCAQHLVAYGVPILVRHPIIQAYSPDISLQAGIELFVFLSAMTGGWWASLHFTRPGRPVAHLLRIMDSERMEGLQRLGFWLVVVGTLYQVLSSLGLLGSVFGALPPGAFPIIFALVSAMTSCGLFLGSMLLASGRLKPMQRAVFWVLLAINTLITASGFLLSAVAIQLFSVAIGLFWGSGRMPWRFVILVSALLAFLNLGKFEMRALYWSQDDDDERVIEPTTLLNMPERYSEWCQASWSIMTETEESTNSLWTTQQQRHATTATGQSLLLRVNNLQNLLYVIDQLKSDMVEPLHGETYAVVPALLIPRLFWPDKPRSHEGQVLLNVHFHRQTLESTYVTYVAWGLLAEAYGNFGPVLGSLIVGLTLGGLFGIIEKKTSVKPLLSLEGFLVFIIFVSVADSFEMVASVLVTSVYQSLLPVTLIGLFVSRRTKLNPTS